MTGDQIYADDVAGPLAQRIAELGPQLTGWDEAIPTGPSPDCVEPSKIDLYGRKPLVAESAKFTSGLCDNHLLTFGEYAAMYLLTWNHRLWPEAFPDPPDSLDDENRLRYYRELLALERFRKTIPQVRRVLANTPTYMMFDDHEITDDWNLTRHWVDSVRESAAGRRIVSNGLAAHWAFQGWGNSPEAFSSRFIEAIRSFIEKRSTFGPEAERYDHRIWSFHRWSYALRTDPPVIALDSRTQRRFDSKFGAARLVDRYGLDWIYTACVDMGRVNPECVILITATPVYGFEPIEMGQKVAGAFGIDPTKLDRESWIANREGFADLMRVLIHEVQAERCIILSGDVHYAFSTEAKFRSNNRDIQIKQLTSSAINNKPKYSGLLENLGRIAEKKEHRFGWEKDPHLALRLTRPFVEVLVRFNLIKESEAFWTDVVHGVLPEGNLSLIYASNNVGWVKIREGWRVGHRLLSGVSGDTDILFDV